MTKQDYELIASVLYRVKPSRTDGGYSYHQWDLTVREFTEALEIEAPRFNRGKFVKACLTGEISEVIKDDHRRGSKPEISERMKKVWEKRKEREAKRG